MLLLLDLHLDFGSQGTAPVKDKLDQKLRQETSVSPSLQQPSKTTMKEKQVISQQKWDDKVKPGPRWEKQACITELCSSSKEYSTVWLWKNTRMLDNNFKSALFYFERQGNRSQTTALRKSLLGHRLRCVCFQLFGHSQKTFQCAHINLTNSINNCHKIQ